MAESFRQVRAVQCLRGGSVSAVKHVRALGVGLSYAIANALFGGSAEYVALWFKSQGIESAFFWYVTVMGAISLVAAILMPDTRRRGYLTAEEARLMEA